MGLKITHLFMLFFRTPHVDICVKGVYVKCMLLHLSCHVSFSRIKHICALFHVSLSKKV